MREIATASYKEAGVDIKRIKQSQLAIGRIISSTHNLQRNYKVLSGFGHYAGLVEIGKNKILATHTDGVGTKVLIAQAMNKYDTIGIDCVAMNVNDLICTGATPISFVDYIAANKNDAEIFKQIVKGLVKGAKIAKVPIVGGETAILPDLISGAGFCFDLAGSAVGILDKKQMVLGENIAVGDIIIGVESTGLHSNAYSLARKLLLSRYSLKDRVKGVGVLGEVLLEPTAIYVQPVLEVLRTHEVHGIAHITGGSFTKLLRLKRTGFLLDNLPEAPAIFQLLQEQGVSKKEMHKTFNMGIGLCVIVPKNQEEAIIKIFERHGFHSSVIGKITQKAGVYTESLKIS